MDEGKIGIKIVELDGIKFVVVKFFVLGLQIN
jgi:hypothetical protein